MAEAINVLKLGGPFNLNIEDKMKVYEYLFKERSMLGFQDYMNILKSFMSGRFIYQKLVAAFEKMTNKDVDQIMKLS